MELQAFQYNLSYLCWQGLPGATWGYLGRRVRTQMISLKNIDAGLDHLGLPLVSEILGSKYISAVWVCLRLLGATDDNRRGSWTHMLPESAWPHWRCLGQSLASANPVQPAGPG